MANKISHHAMPFGGDMDDGKLTQLLWQNATDLIAATPFCPEDQLIASYFEGSLGDQERGRLRNHLVECRYCQARLGNLARSTGAGESPHVPDQLLADAKQIGKRTRPHKRSRKVPAWAAAAVLVLSVILVYSGQWRQGPDNATIQAVAPTGEEATRQLRSLGRIPSSIRIVEPAPGAILMPGTAVRWLGIQGVDRYDIFVLSASGDVVWSERLNTTNWSPRGVQGLTSGDKYYLRVEATLRDGTTLSSRHMDFRFAER
jgi:hypothetical protein